MSLGRVLGAGMRRCLTAVVLLLLLATVLTPVSPVAALDTVNIAGYFEITYPPVEFSQTEIAGGEPFSARVEATATCLRDLPVSLVSQAVVSGRILAQHVASGTRVTLNPGYEVLIEPIPSRAGEVAERSRQISLVFPSASASGGYTVLAELIDARVKTLLGWLSMARYLPPSQVMGTVIYTASETGGGGDVAPSSSSLTGWFDRQGVAVAGFELRSDDKSCSLSVVKGTKALTGSGAPLSGITLTASDDPPEAPQGSRIVGRVYEFGPSGATFDPPLVVAFAFRRGDLPDGTTAADLSIAAWDGGKWAPLDGLSVELASGIATARVAHFTSFALLVKVRPAAFGIADLSITPQRVNAGEVVIIGARVSNRGNSAGVCRVALKIDQDVVEIQEIPLAGGASQDISFRRIETVPGVRAVAVNGLLGHLVVEAAVVKPGAAAGMPPSAPDEPQGASPPASPDPWPIIAGTILAGALVVSLVYRLRRRRG